MSDSKFLKFQDIDNDGLIDVCDDELIEEPWPCEGPCLPNPLAIVSDWKKRTIEEPALNEKFCLYQVTVVTPYKETATASLLEDSSTNKTKIDLELQGKFDEFSADVIESLLTYEEKLDSAETRKYVSDNLIYDKYYLDPRPNSRLKLLYSVPFDVIYNIPPLEEEADEEEEVEPGEMEVTYNAAQMITKMIRVRKGLGLYGRYLKVYRAVDGGNLFFKESADAIEPIDHPDVTYAQSSLTGRLFNLEDYGDIALFSSSILSEMMVQLESFLNAKGLQIPGVGSPGWEGFFAGLTHQRITDIIFKFDNYKLKKMSVYTEECSEKPFIFNSKRLKPLNAQSSWKDKTAVAYLAQLYKMEASLSARVQIPWVEFVQMYTYPNIYSTVDESSSDTVSSCIADALANEAKELGQDILDEVFNIGDVIAHKFNKNVCAIGFEGARFDENDMGTQGSGSGANQGNIFAMAQMQAFKELEKSDQVFVQLCAIILASTTKFGPAMSQLDMLWKHGFEPLKKCGLFDLLMDAIKCLMGGLTLEEALASMVKSALNAMSIENFGDLFIGLPPEKQAELDDLAKKKLESGDIFVAGSNAQEVSNLIAGQGVSKPWENQDIIDAERKGTMEGQFSSVPGAQQQDPGKMRRTIGEQFDVAGQANKDLNPDSIIQAYIIALIEVYQDNLLSLIDELNKFPGAQIVATIIGLFDCPRPPLFNPSFFDFIKSLDNIFCGDINDIRLPRMENYASWLPKIKDITRWLWEAVKYAVKRMIFAILMLLFVKLCELIGDAICKALEVTGDIITSMPDVIRGNTTLRQVVKDSICGEGTSDEQVDDAIIDLLASVGVGGAAFSNRDQTLQFAEDMASSLTTAELAEAFLGNPPSALLEVVDQLIEFEYPQFREALPNKRSIGSFFKNSGNLFPLDYRQHLRDLTEVSPENEQVPANPSICANEEQLQNFKKLRCDMLEGRASPEQCHQMFCDLREGFLSDLDDIGNIAHSGIPKYIMNNMPPVMSTPGCDDGFVPYESEQQIAVTGQALGNDFEQLEIDYIKDMLGNGGFLTGDRSWGFINMVLSDTEGNPLTAHYRKAHNQKSYVNFASNQPNGGEPSTGFFSFMQPGAGFSSQHGQFPYYVGEWMMRQFANAGGSTINPHYGTLEMGGTDLKDSLKFTSTNSTLAAVNYRISFEDLDFNPVMGTGVDLLRIPDMGYNTPIRADMENERVVITRSPRKGVVEGTGAYEKGGADISLDFRDNAAGKRQTCGRGRDGGKGIEDRADSEWSWGFDLQCFFSDIVEEDGVYKNRYDDNIRIKVVEKVNYDADIESPLAGNIATEYEKTDAFDLPGWIENVPVVGWVLQQLVNLIMLPFSSLVRPSTLPGGGVLGSDNILRSREFEFLAVDDGLDGFSAILPSKLTDSEEPDLKLSDYPYFASSITALNSGYPPQVALLADISGQSPAVEKANYDAYMEEIFKRLCKEIGENEGGWKYGMDYDYLTKDELEYVIPEGYLGAGNFYASLTVEDEDGVARPVDKGDMILGVSRNQFDNDRAGTPEKTRVFYLDPNKFGGNTMRPPLYVKPIKYDGWMGFTQVFFPEYSPCKPRNQNLIDFEQLTGQINKRYPSIPEDPRLKQDPDCAVEVPFNRILNRSAKAGMYGLVDAAIRIYASVHMFKAIGVFSKIMPKFPDNFSNIYAAYIIEQMEEGFKDVQAAFWESLNVFKDDMFWYGFLEQSVQYYKFLIDDEQSVVPTAAIQEAMDRINDAQEEYGFPFKPTYEYKYRDTRTGDKKQKTVQGLYDAKMSGDAGFLQTLEGYRRDENLEAVQRLEEDAKLILTELVKIQLNYMGETLVKNMANQGFVPDIFDLDYWIFENLCENDSLEIHSYEIVEQHLSAPAPVSEDSPTTFYTAGGEYRIVLDDDPDNGFDIGDEYVGYYHSHTDEVGDIVYYAGETHTEAPQDLLGAVADAVEVGTIKRTTSRILAEDIGTDDVDNDGASTSEEFVSLGDIFDLGEAAIDGTNHIFAIEKFISINGQQFKPSDAKATIMANKPGARISDIYPGTMRTIENEAGEAVGIEGEMGVQYGINFYYGTSKVLVTSVSVDALDLLIDQTQPFNGSSKLLFCLLNMLKNDPKYKIMTSYIFSIKKVNAILAIYNDMGFLSSIGEVTVANGDATRFVPTSPVGILPGLNPNNRDHWINVSGDDMAAKAIKYKPGMIAYLQYNTVTAVMDDPYWEDETYDVEIKTVNTKKSGTYGSEGWQSYDNRQPGLFGGMFVKEWDNWDRLLLRNSKSRIKKMFRAYYNSRDFQPGDRHTDGPSKIFMENLRARIFPSPGAALLPWWQRGKLRSNPFNSEGGLCDGND